MPVSAIVPEKSPGNKKCDEEEEEEEEEELRRTTHFWPFWHRCKMADWS